MANDNLIMALAKVLIAAAWVDGEISPEEAGTVKEHLLRLPNKLTAHQWAMIDMYLESPVGDAERQRLIAELQAQITSKQDKKTIVTALQTLAAADGTVTPDEKVVVAEIMAALDSASSGEFGGLKRVWKRMAGKNAIVTSQAPNREAYFDDFVKNKVYYNLRRQLEQNNEILNVSDEQLRQLSLAGGVMARVARAHTGVTDTEREIIITTMQRGWNLSHAEASLVVEVALSDEVVTMDRFHLTNELIKVSTVEQLTRFLDVLFTIANADGGASQEEIEEIRNLAHAFNLPDKYFFAAKRKVAEKSKL